MLKDRLTEHSQAVPWTRSGRQSPQTELSGIFPSPAVSSPFPVPPDQWYLRDGAISDINTHINTHTNTEKILIHTYRWPSLGSQT